ncbi:MAG: domain containing protein [Bacteroidetes bacterium]|jgi:gliding motility-associated-like protein|nr:domain containing protein [Bacteroidota bacterium]
MKKAFAYSLLFLLLGIKLRATHIVGGEIIYDKLNDSTYKITLKVYRDCFNGVPPFDGASNGTTFSPCILTVYTGDSLLVGTYDIGAPVITNIPPTINNPCVQPPGGICVEEGVYTYTLTLPPKAKGYYVIYQRCCRNGTILNLVAPGSQGGTYYTFIPGPEVVASNNSPRYASFPPIFICNNVNFTFDHHATDPDGDQLVYSLCAPFQGLDPNCATVTSPNCLGYAVPPPYPTVNFVGPYNGGYPIASNPAFAINSVTGLLTGRPNLLGQYVVGVCVQEFRNGTLIQTHYRDFQFNVVSCIVQVVSGFAEQEDKCLGSAITFTNQSFGNLGGLTYHWDFGVPVLTDDTSNIFNPTYTYPDTGKYQVTLIANPNKPCCDTFKGEVYVYPPLQIDFPPLNKQCFKGNAFTFSVQGAYLPSATFKWDFGAASTPSVSTLKNPPPVSYTQPGKYFVKLIGKQLTCIDSFIDTVRVIGPPVAKINNLPTSLCDPAKVVFSNGSASDLPLTYQWYFSNGNASIEYQPTQVFSPVGVYSATLMAFTSGLCIDTSITSVKNITVNPSPKAGFTFTPEITTIFDPEITFMNKASWDVSKWEYNFGDGTGTPYASDVHVYQDYGDYTITQVVTNPYGCKDTIVKTLKILPEHRFWIPNTFTPDDNLLNDNFLPIAIGIINYEFDIFTRWGELIYSTQNPKEGWNGFYKGKECQQDVYVWRIIFKNVVTEKDEIHYGHVTLLKNR